MRGCRGPDSFEHYVQCPEFVDAVCEGGSLSVGLQCSALRRVLLRGSDPSFLVVGFFVYHTLVRSAPVQRGIVEQAAAACAALRATGPRG